jgi:hypothetical protein
MPINTHDNYVASAKQAISLNKSVTTRSTVGTGWFSMFDMAGNPGAGTLAGTSTTSGVVPTPATVAGYPLINAFGGAATGYLTGIDYGNTAASRMAVWDEVFKAGAYAFTAGTTALTAQPSYSTRMPNGTDFTNTQIWVQISTAFVTGTAWQVQVTYTNQSGITGRTSVILPAQAAAGLTLGREYQLGLQAGDTGVQKIESVIVTNGGTTMTAGAFNILVVRPLWMGRVRASNDGDVHDYIKLGLPQVFATSALALQVCPDGGTSGQPELWLEIANA